MTSLSANWFWLVARERLPLALVVVGNASPCGGGDTFCRFRVVVRLFSASSDDDFLFLKEREPSSGSSSTIKELKTEWELTSWVSLSAGSRSFVMLETADFRRAVEEFLVFAGDSLTLHSGHLHLSAPKNTAISCP